MAFALFCICHSRYEDFLKGIKTYVTLKPVHFSRFTPLAPSTIYPPPLPVPNTLQIFHHLLGNSHCLSQGGGTAHFGDHWIDKYWNMSYNQWVVLQLVSSSLNNNVSPPNILLNFLLSPHSTCCASGKFVLPLYFWPLSKVS